ncbi:MAG: phage holin family protein [bacterium]|nr:phage holin family protein [bacterium]
MKKIFRMFLFSLVALYITSLWNKGFLLHSDWTTLLKAAFAVALIYYVIVPVSKIVLLPINLLTLGLASTIVSLFLLYLLSHSFNLIDIKEWTFGGVSLLGMAIQKMHISGGWNLVLSSLSVSVIINMLEKLL